jgi:hypothetical protein
MREWCLIITLTLGAQKKLKSEGHVMKSSCNADAVHY